MMSLWLLASFALCLACDWLAVKHMFASSDGRPWVAAVYSGAWTLASAAGLVLVVRVSLWLLLADVFGHALGTYFGVRSRRTAA